MIKLNLGQGHNFHQISYNLLTANFLKPCYQILKSLKIWEYLNKGTNMFYIIVRNKMCVINISLY